MILVAVNGSGDLSNFQHDANKHPGGGQPATERMGQGTFKLHSLGAVLCACRQQAEKRICRRFSLWQCVFLYTGAFLTHQFASSLPPTR